MQRRQRERASHSVWNGPACTPGSVLPRKTGECRSSLSGCRCRHPLAAYPQTRRGASTSAVWPCCERGLPSRPCHHERWWSLTPPFQPYRFGEPKRRSTLCCTFSRVTPGGCYPPFPSVQPGRSSARSRATRSTSRPIPTSMLLEFAYQDGAAARAKHDLVERCCTDITEF